MTPTVLPAPATPFAASLEASVRRAWADIDAIPDERRAALDHLAAWIDGCRDDGRPAQLIFICTHNSRRSHMAQLWTAAAAAWFGADDIRTFSGGTETTAFDRRARAALVRAGFEIDAPTGDNPRCRVTVAPGAPPLEAWSKIYDDATNPRDGFAAIMTCDAADQACPVVPGAALRVALPFSDPKLADGTPVEAATYDERALQIATQMLYLVSRTAR